MLLAKNKDKDSEDVSFTMATGPLGVGARVLNTGSMEDQLAALCLPLHPWLPSFLQGLWLRAGSDFGSEQLWWGSLD